MLTCKPSLLSREQFSKKFIKESLNSNQQVYFNFIGPNTASKYNIINKQVIIFLVNITPSNNRIFHLNLNSCQITDPLLKLLSKGQFYRLKDLFLFKNHLTGMSLIYLRDGKWKNLQKLDLGQNPIKNYVNHRLFEQCLPQSLQILMLQKLELHSKFIQGIRSNDWSKLKKIYFAENFLANEGLNHLVCCNWPCLQVLDLQNNGITNDGLKNLRKGNWKYLEYLSLQHNYIDEEGVELLSQTVWQKLKSINLSTSKFLEKGLNIEIEMQVCVNMMKVLSKFKQNQMTVHLFYRMRYTQNQHKVQKMMIHNKEIYID